MKEFKDKVAVITGGASGIGRAIADRCAAEGMRIVLADIEQAALAQAESELKASGAQVLALQTDVSKAGDIEQLAQKTLQAFGAVHLLCNNAGVGAGTTVWDSTLADWQWVLGVNLWGIIHGVRTFVPIMLAQDTEGYIVNTASMAGLLQYHPCSAYQVSKFGAVALSENTYFYLKQMKAKIGISVLCPGWVKTHIMDSERNRPVELQNKAQNEPMTAEDLAAVQSMAEAVESGIPAKEAADAVFDAIQKEQFYIIIANQWNSFVQMRHTNILHQRNPDYVPGYQMAIGKVLSKLGVKR